MLKKITAYFTHYPLIFKEIHRISLNKDKTTSQVVVGLTALGLKKSMKRKKA